MANDHYSTFASYESPELLIYGKVEDLTQVKPDTPPGQGGGGNGGGSTNKNPGAQDGSKSKVL